MREGVSPVMKGKALLTPVSRAASILLSRLSFFMYTFQQTKTPVMTTSGVVPLSLTLKKVK